jgi:hypothetical protein
MNGAAILNYVILPVFEHFDDEYGCDDFKIESQPVMGRTFWQAMKRSYAPENVSLEAFFRVQQLHNWKE